MLLACQADAQGRTGLEQRPYPQATYLREILAACRKIDVQAIIKEGYTGPQIKEQLHRQRISTARQYKNNYTP